MNRILDEFAGSNLGFHKNLCSFSSPYIDIELSFGWNPATKPHNLLASDNYDISLEHS